MGDEVEKIKKFQVSLYDEGRIYLNILNIDIEPFFECLWNISIFGRNSGVSKVLAHVMSDEVEKNLNFQVSFYDEGRFELNFLTIDIGINFECFWTISIFGRNS